MHRPICPSLSLLLALAACGADDEPAAPESSCAITERVRLVAPPDDITLAEDGDYTFHVIDEFVLYSFQDADDPARTFWKLDRCTGEVEPFPSLTPDLYAPHVVDTPAGRVLYAKKHDAYYVVDRLDVPGHDEPREVAGLPRAGFLDLNLYGHRGRPYAFYWRDHDLYTHSGDPEAPALRVAEDTLVSVPYEDTILASFATGELRAIDPFTGDSELVMAGADDLVVLWPADSVDDTRVVWQPMGEPTLRARRLGDGDDIALAVDPAFTLADLYWTTPDSLVAVFADPMADTLGAAVRLDTGEALAVPEHLAFDLVSERACSLVIADGDERVEALWDLETGALREWYRGDAPTPRVWAVGADSVDYFVQELDDPPLGSLWRVDLGTGERREVLARISAHNTRLDEHRYLVQFHFGPTVGAVQLPLRYDLKHVDLRTGLFTTLAESTSHHARVGDEGLLYLETRGPEPGIWAVPLP